MSLLNDKNKIYPSSNLFEEPLEKRAYDLATKLFSKDGELNLDTLLDSLQSFYYEIKNSNLKSGGYEYFCKKVEKAVELIQSSRVNVNDFVHLKLLGQGGFGKVALVKHKHSNNVYAMKIMKKNLLLRSNQSAFFIEERHIMALSDSPWLVKIHYAFIDKDDIYMVMDFMQGGDMINLMSTYDMPLEWIQFYAAEAAIALNSLHEFGFIHLDVKPDNMLLDKNGHLKLCDFGTCVNVRKDGYFICNFAVGTPDYISPEMLSSHNKPTKIGFSTDWWSYGVFLYELLFDETPFASDSLVGTYTKIANFESSLKFPDNSSSMKPVCNLISLLLVDAQNRPNFDMIKSHEFFKNKFWTFENIRQSVPPFIPEIHGDEDTSNFDVSESASASNSTLAPKKESFSGIGGDQLNFIGFSYNPAFNDVKNIISKSLSPSEEKMSHSSISKSQRSSFTDDTVDIELNNFKEKLSNYQKLLHDIECQNKNLNQSKNQLNVQLQNVSLQLKQETDKNKDLLSQLQQYSTKVNEYDIKTQEYLTKISHLTSEIDSANDRCRQLENEKAKFELKYTDYQHNSNTLKKNFGGVEKKLKELQVKYEESLAEIDRLTMQLNIEQQRRNTIKGFPLEQDDNTPSQNSSSSILNRLSLANELMVPAVQNRTAILKQSETHRGDADECFADQSTDKNYFKAEIQNLKEIIKQSTENECKIKNDLRLITNENERLKHEMKTTLENIKNNPDFLELDHKCKSLESYMNLYKKQVRELTLKVDTLKNEALALNTKFDEQSSINQKLELDLNDVRMKYTNEITKNKDLIEQMELKNTSYIYEISELKRAYDTASQELDDTRRNLFESENKVIDLTKKLADISTINKENIIINSGSNKENNVEPDSNINWKEQYLLEKMKKDQAIKKLDEMVYALNRKGKTVKRSPNNTSVNVDSKATKKLQMELRNEKIRYEKLLLEKQAALFEYNDAISRLESKVSKLKEKNNQLQSLVESAGRKGGCNTSTLLDFRDQNNTMSVSVLHDNRKKSSFSTLNDYNDQQNDETSYYELVSEIHSDNDPFQSALSASEEPHPSVVVTTFSSKPNVHFEGFVSLIPYNKMKRSARKISWKKHYAILTYTHFSVYTEKVDKDNPRKLFKKILIEHIQKATHITANDLLKCDSKDLPKILCLKYYDADLAGVTTSFNPEADNFNDSKKTDSNENIKEYKRHQLLLTNIDNQLLCGSCSLDLSKNINGNQLLQCYQCKLCHQKFHTSHVHLNDNSILDCQQYAANDTNCINPTINVNSNFIVDMFLLAPSSEEKAKWIYAFNHIIKHEKSLQNSKTKRSLDNELLEDSPSKRSGKLKKKDSFLSKPFSFSKSKGFSAS